MRRWKAHRGRITSLSFSRDGRLLASCTGSGRDVFIWNALTGELVRKLSVTDEEGEASYREAQSVAFAPDSDLLAVGRYQWVELWETSGWRRLMETRGSYSNEVTIGPGDAPLLAACCSTSAEVWEIRSAGGSQLTPIAQWPVGDGLRLTFSPDGRRIVTHTTQDVAIYDLLSHALVKEFAHPRGNYGGPVRFSPDSSRLAFCYTKTIESHRAALDDPADVIRYAGHTNKVWALRYTPDGSSLISASSDGTVRVWEAVTGLQKRVFDMNVGKLATADVSPDGTLAAVGGTTGEIVVWDLE